MDSLEDPITSFRNPRVKYLRSLRLRKYRQREGHFLIEGIRIVQEAISSGAAVETVVYAPELLVSERAAALVKGLDPGLRLALSGDVFHAISDRDNPQGLAALVRIEDLPLQAIPLSQEMLVVVACELRDPGNLGSLIRTADAAGATGVVIVGPSVDLYDPQTVRATMGSLFALPIVRVENEASLGSWYAQIRDADLPLLVVPGVVTDPPVAGRVWAEASLQAGLKIAEELGGRREQLRLKTVDVSNFAFRRDPRRSEVVLYTAGDTEIRWGRAPTPRAAMLQERSVAEKARYLDYVYERLGNVDGVLEYVDIPNEVIRRRATSSSYRLRG